MQKAKVTNKMMRIITGRAKGIRLETLEGVATRPTSERVKEALFSSLQFDIQDRSILDLFSGSGQLALEALSRGAAHAVMIDRSKDAVRIIKQNANKTKLADMCEVHNCEFKEYILKNKGKKFDIIFIDPPYAAGLYDECLSLLLSCDMIKPSTLIVCESETEDLLADNSALKEQLDVFKQARYGRACICIFRKKGNS